MNEGKDDDQDYEVDAGDVGTVDDDDDAAADADTNEVDTIMCTLQI